MVKEKDEQRIYDKLETLSNRIIKIDKGISRIDEHLKQLNSKVAKHEELHSQKEEELKRIEQEAYSAKKKATVFATIASTVLALAGVVFSIIKWVI